MKRLGILFLLRKKRTTWMILFTYYLADLNKNLTELVVVLTTAN